MKNILVALLVIVINCTTAFAESNYFSGKIQSISPDVSVTAPDGTIKVYKTSLLKSGGVYGDQLTVSVTDPDMEMRCSSLLGSLNEPFAVSLVLDGTVREVKLDPSHEKVIRVFEVCDPTGDVLHHVTFTYDRK